MIVGEMDLLRFVRSIGIDKRRIVSFGVAAFILGLLFGNVILYMSPSNMQAQEEAAGPTASPGSGGEATPSGGTVPPTSPEGDKQAQTTSTHTTVPGEQEPSPDTISTPSPAEPTPKPDGGAHSYDSYANVSEYAEVIVDPETIYLGENVTITIKNTSPDKPMAYVLIIYRLLPSGSYEEVYTTALEPTVMGGPTFSVLDPGSTFTLEFRPQEPGKYYVTPTLIPFNVLEIG